MTVPYVPAISQSKLRLSTGCEFSGVAHSGINRLKKALAARRIFTPDPKDSGPSTRLPTLINWSELGRDDAEFENAVLDIIDRMVPVLIMQDWAHKIEQAAPLLAGDEWKLPFPNVAFEFRLADLYEGQRDPSHHTILQIEEDEQTGKVEVRVWEESPNHWTVVKIVDNSSLGEFYKSLIDYGRNAPAEDGFTQGAVWAMCLREIRAACIAVDCGVADLDTERVPAKLAKARAKRGAPPLPDVRIINLSLRQRELARHNATDPNGTHVRLHLRRGHWWPRLENTESRFAKFRKWRPWQLVGDANLGFVEHQYRI